MEARAGGDVQPVTDVRDISRIAYGFMASKALFAALNLDLFTRLRGAARDLDTLSRETGVPASRLDTLLSALTGVGLLVRRDGGWANAPGSERYLVRGSRADFGDYYRYQIDRIVYPAMAHLDAGMAGDLGGLAPRVQADRDSAEDFTRAQHAGSLGPAYLLSRAIDLGGRQSLLDVGAGSGAFAITLCRAARSLRATLLDFPHMLEVARRFVDEAQLADRIAFLPGGALEVDWPAAQEIVLMSYLLSAVPGRDLEPLIDRAWESMAPGGLLLVHDFMLDEDRGGPPLAALWFLSYLAWSTDNASFTAGDIAAHLRRRGFVDVEERPMVHGITTLVSAVRPK
jgi:2-hydroxy-4-(methylsulfanyl)butanoate S-methyltransferase